MGLGWGTGVWRFTLYTVRLPGADPGFPTGGGANPPGRTPTYDFIVHLYVSVVKWSCHFKVKLQKKKILEHSEGYTFNGKVNDHIGSQSLNVKVTWHGLNVT